MAKQTKQNTTNNLWTIFGARKSKNGERVNVSLVKGNDDNKEWSTITLKLAGESKTVAAKIKDGFAYLKIKMLADREENNDAEDFD